jgi:Methionine synthase I (cobalamin-dependent), methyltransferase domain
MTAPASASIFAQAFADRILVFDGAMGTMIQARDLSAEDFGGAQLEGCNENLNLTRPDVIREIHEAYLDAGADCISTNTFGCAPYVLAEYGLAGSVSRYRPGRGPARQDRRGQPVHRRSPALCTGGMGPGTRTITVTGGVTFDEVLDAYYRQARALIEGGVDALLLETCQDTLNVKAAAIGVKRAMAEAGRTLPLMVSGTIEPMGTMLAGQGVDALYASLEHLDLFSVGLNCATGPEFMTDHLRSLGEIATCFVTVYPNAGLPDDRGRYEETPESLALKTRRFVEEGWVNAIGGCCGTTPDHIAEIAKAVAGLPPRSLQTSDLKP